MLKFIQQLESLEVPLESNERAFFGKSVAMTHPDDKLTSQFWNARTISDWTIGVENLPGGWTTTFRSHAFC